MIVRRMRFLLGALSLALLAPAMSYGSTAADSLSLRGKVRVVPNPWVASKESQQFGGTTGNYNTDRNTGYSRVTFLNLPSTATIRIYTIDGNLVRTIEHPYPLGGQTRWTLISDSGQYVASGIYIYVVDSPVGRDVGKIIIIR